MYKLTQNTAVPKWALLGYGHHVFVASQWAVSMPPSSSFASCRSAPGRNFLIAAVVVAVKIIVIDRFFCTRAQLFLQSTQEQYFNVHLNNPYFGRISFFWYIFYSFSTKNDQVFGSAIFSNIQILQNRGSKNIPCRRKRQTGNLLFLSTLSQGIM